MGKFRIERWDDVSEPPEWRYEANVEADSAKAATEKFGAGLDYAAGKYRVKVEDAWECFELPNDPEEPMRWVDC